MQTRRNRDAAAGAKFTKADGQQSCRAQILHTMEAVNGVEANISARDVGEQVRRQLERLRALLQLALKPDAGQTWPVLRFDNLLHYPKTTAVL